MRISILPQQLAAFAQLARTGSFSETARRQGVSQPALSRSVQQMEAAIGRRLFDRTTRSVVLTPTGQELLPIAERLVAEFDSSFGELARFIDGLLDPVCRGRGGGHQARAKSSGPNCAGRAHSGPEGVDVAADRAEGAARAALIDNDVDL